jgi:hypothetical protein
MTLISAAEDERGRWVTTRGCGSRVKVDPNFNESCWNEWASGVDSGVVTAIPNWIS